MIEFNRLTKRFGENVAIDGISSTVADGVICGLAGSNGSGKSTLLRMMTGVYRPDGGEVLIDGVNVFDSPTAKARCYYISDYPYFASGMSIRKLAAFTKSMYKTWDNDTFLKLSQSFPLNHNAPIINMSKGMQRQAAIIIALSTKPEYLFLDEIFDGLDPVIRQMFKKIIIENVTDRGMTAVIASHNLREFDDICDTMIMLHNGKIVENSSVDELKSTSFKVQIAFNRDVTPDIFAGLSIINLMQRSRYFTFIISGNEDEIRQKLAVTEPAFIDLVPLTLEEVFIKEMGDVGYEVV